MKKNTLKIKGIPIKELVDTSKMFGDTDFYIIYQIDKIIEANRNIKNFIELSNLKKFCKETEYEEMGTVNFYRILLKKLQKIDLKNLEEYKALEHLLVELIKLDK